MAGMPVGPLSLSDEVALDLVLKIMKATEADLGAMPSTTQKKLLVEMVEKQGRFGRKNGKDFTISRKRARPEEPVVGVERFAAKTSRSRYA